MDQANVSDLSQWPGIFLSINGRIICSTEQIVDRAIMIIGNFDENFCRNIPLSYFIVGIGSLSAV